MRDDGRLECIENYGDGACGGAVEYRAPLSGTGRSFPRCDKHWARRLEEEERIREARETAGFEVRARAFEEEAP